MFKLEKLFSTPALETAKTEVAQHYAEAVKPNAAPEKLWWAARPIIWVASSLPFISIEWRQILLAFVQLGDKTWLTAPQNTDAPPAVQ